MKKILVSVLAVAAMVACSTEHTVVKVENNEAIGFDTFVDNSTRADDVTTPKLQKYGFNVYASVTNADNVSGLILENEPVTYNGAWSYEKTQYWVPGNTYNFVALAPTKDDTKDDTKDAKWAYAAENGTAHNGVISFDNRAAAANQDLVFAYANRNVESAYTSTPETVKFTFAHMLSRVRFSFTNSFVSDGNIKLVVTNVHITDAYAKGTLDVEAGAPVAAWVPDDNTLDVEFGAVATTLAEGDKDSTEHFYLIPNSESATYTVTFDVTLIQAGVEIDTYSHEVELTCAMNRGCSYDITTSLTPENTSDEGAIYPIVFEVTKVEEWDDYSDVALEATTVATADELAAAIAEGGDVRLTSDINLDEVMVTRASTYTYGLFIEKDCVIDGNGYTITTTASRGIAVSGANDVTLKNFTFNSTGERGIQVQGGAKNVTIENVTAVAANYTVNLPSSAGATVVTINNCDLKGLNTVNIGAPGAVVTLNNTTLRSEDNNAAENYSVICVNKDAAGAKVYVNGGEIIVTGTNAEGTNGGSVQCEGGDIIFNGTKGNTTISERKFAIIYGDYWYSYSSLEKAYEKAQAGETIVLLQDATVADGIIVEKNVNFDLNGHTLKYTGDDVLFRVYGAEFTINGTAANSAIVTNPTQHAGESAGNGYVAFVKDNGVVNFNGGSYDAQATCTIAQASANGTVNVYAGEFQVDMTKYTVDGHAQYLLNCSDAAYKAGTAVIKVYGGSFYKFNPANNVAEGANTNFVATGYTVEQNGDWYIVK